MWEGFVNENEDQNRKVETRCSTYEPIMNWFMVLAYAFGEKNDVKYRLLDRIESHKFIIKHDLEIIRSVSKKVRIINDIRWKWNCSANDMILMKQPFKMINRTL